MLQKLNERIQGLVAWVIVGLVAITFAMFGLDYLFQNRGMSQAVVMVNGQSISQSTFERLYRQVRQQDKVLSQSEESVIKNQILEELIVRTLTVQSAEKSGFLVSDNQAKETIIHIPQFQEDGHFSPARFQQVLMASMYTTETLQQEVKQGMMLNQQRFGLIGSAFVLPQDLKQYTALLFQTRTYDYLVLPWAHFVSKTPIRQETIAAYYEKHLQDFKSPPVVSLAYLEISLDKIKAQTQVSDSEVEQYQEAEQSKEKMSEQKKQAIYQQILNDKAEHTYAKLVEQLTELAYEYPDSLTHAATTLKLPILYTGFFSEKGGQSAVTQNPLVIKAAFSEEVLSLGNNSEPVQVDPSRVVVLRVEKQKGAYIKPLKEVAPQIEQTLQFREAKALAKQTAKTILAGKGLPTGFQWKGVSDLSRDTETEYPQVRDMAFELPKPGEMSEAFLPNGDYVLVKLKAIQAGDWDTLDEEQKNSLSQQLAAAYGALDYDIFVHSLVDTAKIKR